MKRQKFLTEFLAWLTVSFAALSLGAAFGLQSWRWIFAGMLAAGIIPIITSLLGWTKIQASGPTAPMTTVTALIVAYGFDQYSSTTWLSPEHFVSLVCLLAWGMMILWGILRLGTLIRFIPNLIIIGFMNGIAVLIRWDQLKKLLWLAWQAALTWSLVSNVLITIGTLILLFVLPMLLSRLPIKATLRAMIPVTLLVILLLSVVHTLFALGWETVTMGDPMNSWGAVSAYMMSYIPHFSLITWTDIMHALPLAGQLALLWYLDSLLTSLVIDKMTASSTQKNRELMAQWIANAFVGMIWWIPGAQATIRSVLLIKEKAQTRLAGVFVWICTLIMIFVLQWWMQYIALAIFVGVLLKAWWDVFEKDFLIMIVKNKLYGTYAWLVQIFFVLYTTLVTVFIDLNVAVISWTILFLIGKKYLQFKDLGDQIDDLVYED